MLDVIFILLIFFLVTASFLRESVVEVDRPDSRSAKAPEERAILVRIAHDDRILIEELAVDPRALAAHVSRHLALRPEATVAVHASGESSAGALVTVIDQARLAGAGRVALTRLGADP